MEEGMESQVVDESRAVDGPEDGNWSKGREGAEAAAPDGPPADPLFLSTSTFVVEEPSF